MQRRKHIFIKPILLVLGAIILLFSQCQKSNRINYSQLYKIENEINQNPIADRISKWDELIQSDSLDPIYKAYFVFDKANDLSSMQKEVQAIVYFKKALKDFKAYNLDTMQAKTLINLGICYAFTNQKNTAAESVLKGLDLANELKDTASISRAYGELAHIYYLNNNKDKAIRYLKKSINLYRKKKDTQAISAIYNNIGIIYQERHKTKEAYNYMLKSLQLKDTTDNPLDLIETYNNLGALTYALTKNKQKALIYYQKALKIAYKEKFQSEDIYKNLGDLYEDTGQIETAKHYYRLAIRIPNGNYDDKIKLYNKLLYLDLKQNQNQSALTLLKQKDSIYNLQQNMINRENQKNIESNLALITKQKQLAQAKQLNKKNRIIFIFIIIIFLLGLFISYQLNRVDKLKYRQEQFILEQKVLRSQMNPHFIFNVLSSIQNSLIENNPILSATYLSKFAKLIRQNFDYIQKKQISLQKELEMIRNYLDTQKFRYKEKFDYQININPDIDQYKTGISPMILQPFLENAIEHGFKNLNYKGNLEINISKNGHQICFEIIDNGMGYNPQPDFKEHALSIFKKRLTLLGKEAIESFKITNLPQGTKVAFCLPDQLP